MSNALLLRLFTSEFFNSWIAVSYLFRYPDNVGIQHYLCAELKKFPISEIEFFLPQLAHLLITRPSESVALECFLIDMCEQSTHMAIMSLWYLQAYLSDLSLDPSSASFELCKRLLNKCQAIVFSDGQTSDSEQPEVEGVKEAHMVSEHAMPALVGMGAMLLGIGQPLMTRSAGRIALAQGRQNRSFSLTTALRRNTVGTSRHSVPSPPTKANSVDALPLSQPRSATPFQSASQPDLPLHRHSLPNPFTSSPSLEDLHRGKAFSVSRYLRSAHQKINRKIRPQSPLSVFDPKLTALAQSSVPTESVPLSPALSHCSASSSEEGFAQPSSSRARNSLPPIATSFELHQNSDHESDSEASDEEYSALSTLSLDHRKSLLRSNYFRSEMQFLLALVDIATRLVIVPKPARQNALHAELTLLNHNLPAEVCIPLWCPATAEKPYHHRVVRISPSDAVVLNSAERAPYLLTIEVLDDELSFEDSYSSALYRIRRTMKRNKARKENGASSHASCSPCQSPLNKTFRATDMSDSESGESVGSLEKQAIRRRSSDAYAERMRTAAIMLAQLQQNSVVSLGVGSSRSASAKSRQSTSEIQQRIIKEMVALEEQRMETMHKEGVSSGVGDGGEGGGSDRLDDEQRMAWVVNKEDPSAAVLSEDWDTKKARIRAASPYGHLPNWRLLSVIVKNGADLRQEQFAIQLIREMQRIWQDTAVNVWVKYFRVLVTSDNSGLIETLRNTISVHSIKKDAYTRGWNAKGVVFTLRDYFERTWGAPESEKFVDAQDAFMRSLAGYSIACYILQIKDRHNGNLLVDDAGHLIHIDFGFMLSNSPGSVGFELAPFKLAQEYIDILGGVNSEKFAEYKALLKAAFLAVRKHSENILLLVEMMSKDSKLPCFQNGDQTVQQLRDRFQLHLTEPQAEEFVDKLVMSSCCNVFTRLYDTYQYYSQGIL
ncbi:kinase-like domain-containing protein [Phycomyces nitens]|nr:kinase-like domain-containing protein [Phycomyces nitens]